MSWSQAVGSLVPGCSLDWSAGFALEVCIDTAACAMLWIFCCPKISSCRAVAVKIKDGKKSIFLSRKLYSSAAIKIIEICSMEITLEQIYSVLIKSNAGNNIKVLKKKISLCVFTACIIQTCTTIDKVFQMQTCYLLAPTVTEQICTFRFGNIAL